jgi:hypothetical protein
MWRSTRITTELVRFIFKNGILLHINDCADISLHPRLFHFAGLAISSAVTNLQREFRSYQYRTTIEIRPPICSRLQIPFEFIFFQQLKGSFI